MAFAQDLFAGMGRVVARRIFGAAGLFVDGVMFGLIDDGAIYLKTDASLTLELAQFGSRPLIFIAGKGATAGVEQKMSYWSLPEAARDDPDEACDWGRQAQVVAKRAKR